MHHLPTLTYWRRLYLVHPGWCPGLVSDNISPGDLHKNHMNDKNSCSDGICVCVVVRFVFVRVEIVFHIAFLVVDNIPLFGMYSGCFGSFLLPIDSGPFSFQPCPVGNSLDQRGSVGSWPAHGSMGAAVVVGARLVRGSISVVVASVVPMVSIVVPVGVLGELCSNVLSIVVTLVGVACCHYIRLKRHQYFC